MFILECPVDLHYFYSQFSGRMLLVANSLVVWLFLSAMSSVKLFVSQMARFVDRTAFAEP